jgi:hypothetical protein
VPNCRSKDGPITIQQRVGLFLRLYQELKKEPYSQGEEISISFSFGGPNHGIQTNTHRQEFRAYLVLFRQLINPSDNVYLGAILGALPRHVADLALRERLSRATRQWKAANGISSLLAPVVLGPFASGRALARLYLNGGVFHSDLRLSKVWDSAGPDQQRFIEYEFRQFEGRVRLVVIELKKVIDEASQAGVLREEPIDLSRPDGDT